MSRAGVADRPSIDLIDLAEGPPEAPPDEPSLLAVGWRGLRAWARAHRVSLAVAAAVVLAVGMVHWIGYDRWPARLNDDEGTYVSQAWAVQSWHTLAHYTYWYDHPPFGWITLAGYTWLTRAFERLPTAVTAGREAMLWAKILSAALLYLLGRRLGFGRVAVAGAVLLFGLCPLGLLFQRMVFLDNLAVVWVLAALALAVSPRRSLAAAAGSAICFGLAVLTKETVLVLFPALALLLWQHTSPQTRRYGVPLFLTLLGGVLLFYPLYALLKNELFEGPGHVSLLWAVKWQLFERPPSGSVLDPASDSRGILRFWFDQDPWLLVGASLLVPVGLWLRRTRAVTLALAIQVAMLFRGGYLPYPYVIAVMPFAALVVAGVTDQLWRGAGTWAGAGTGARRVAVGRAGQAAIALGLVAALVLVGPAWGRALRRAMIEDDSQPPKQALAWVLANVPARSQLLVDDNLWTDLVRNGFNPNPIWFHKLDLDPAIRGSSPGRWRDIDYVMLGNLPPSVLRDLPLVTTAIRHSEVVASFGDGEITIRRVVSNGSG
jgi:hypothetical protein